MWKERINVDTSFLQPTHALRCALEELAVCLNPVPPFVGVKDHLLTFSGLNFQSPRLAFPPATILRCVMTTMINFEAKPLLEAMCPTQAPRALHGPTDASVCACWIRHSLIRNIFKAEHPVA